MIEIILGKLNRIEAKLDEVIKALHEYDDDGYGESSFDAFIDEQESNKRMDIIGQNGNEGLHYTSHHVSNEEADEDAFNDYGQKKMGWFDENNNPASKCVSKPLIEGKNKSNSKEDTGKTQAPPPPKPPKSKRKYYKPKQSKTK